MNGLTTHILKKAPKCVVNYGGLRYVKHRKRYLMIKFLLKLEVRAMSRAEKVELTVLCLLHQEGRCLLQNRVKKDWQGVTLPGVHVEPIDYDFI